MIPTMRKMIEDSFSNEKSFLYRYAPLMKDKKKFDKYMKNPMPGDIFKDFQYGSYGTSFL